MAPRMEDESDTGASRTGAWTVTKPSIFQHHTLQLHFPVVQLLPEGKRPFIEAPRGMADREEPAFDPLGLDPEDLEFFVRVATDHGITDDSALREGEAAELSVLAAPLNLAACIHRLSTFAGLSHLRVISYVDDSDVFTRFHLITTFYTNAGKLSAPDIEYELGSAEVSRLIKTLGTEDEWVRCLADLMYADSDRAFLCRRARLLEYDAEWTMRLEATWVVEWDENPLKTARDLFADRLVNFYQDEDGNVSTEPVCELMACRDEAIRARLPCGHTALLPPNYIHDMPVRDLLSAVCDACDTRIMTRRDDRALRLYYDRAKRYAWEDTMLPWAGKHRKVRNDARLVAVEAAALAASIASALRSFQLLESVNPRALCPTTYPENQTLLDKLGEALESRATLPAMTPKQLFRNLEELAWTLVQDGFGDEHVMNVALPPGFDNFVGRWLTRAVNDAVGSQADESNDRDVMQVLRRMQRTKIDPRAAGVEADLDVILERIGSTKLEMDEVGDLIEEASTAGVKGGGEGEDEEL